MSEPGVSGGCVADPVARAKGGPIRLDTFTVPERVQPAGRINLDKNWRKDGWLSIAGARVRWNQSPQIANVVRDGAGVRVATDNGGHGSARCDPSRSAPRPRCAAAPRRIGRVSPTPPASASGWGRSRISPRRSSRSSRPRAPGWAVGIRMGGALPRWGETNFLNCAKGFDKVWGFPGMAGAASARARVKPFLASFVDRVLEQRRGAFDPAWD